MKLSINSTKKSGLLRDLRFRLVSSSDKNQFLIVTPNPEQALLAESDKEFRKIIESAEFAICDGVGLAMSEYFFSLKSPKHVLFRLPTLLFQGAKVGLMGIFDRKTLTEKIEIIHGSDFFWDLINLGNKLKLKYALIGGVGSVAEKSCEIISNSHKNIGLLGITGPNLKSDGRPRTLADAKIENALVSKINDFKPDMIFVGFGAPKQEKWIARNLPKLNTKGAMVVGGTFDYISGKVKNPPKWIKDIEMEWFWRLITRARFKRITDAVIVFPVKVFFLRLFNSVGEKTK